MHASYIRPGGVARLPLGLSEDIFLFTQQFAYRIDELEEVLTNNRIWKQRLVDIGIVTAQQAVADWVGIQRCNVRRLGVCWGLRKENKRHDRLDFDVPVGTRRDCYDRYCIRIGENKVFESLRNVSIK